MPQALIDLYKKNKRKAGQKHRDELIRNKQVVTEADLIQTFKKAGITSGDVLMVHSALSKIGYVENGANAMISALQSVVGNDGTIMMPAFPAVGYNYDYLKNNPVFDLNHTPSKMGSVTEAFRKKTGVLRSLHPTDSVSASGKQADYLVKDHFGQITPYNKFSPFYRLSELNGKVLMIGVKLDSLTNLHTLEDAVADFKYPVYHETTFTANLIDASGKKVSMQTKAHNPVYSKKRRCNDLIEPFEKAGFLKHFKLGLADCMLIKAGAMHHWMVENYKTKGITMYTPKGE